MPGTRTILSPKTGAAGINRKKWLPVRLDEFSPTSAGTTATTTDDLPSFQEATGGSAQQWTDRAYLLANDGTQAQLGSATVEGIANKIVGASFGGFTGPAGADWASELEVVAHNYLAWTATEGPGEATVRIVVAYKGERIGFLDSHNAAAYVGGATASAISGTHSIFEALRQRIAPRRFYLTVQELDDAIEDLEFLVCSWAGDSHRVTAWYAGPVELKLTYYTVKPNYCGSYRFEVYDEDPTGPGPPTATFASSYQEAAEENPRRFFLGADALEPGDGDDRWIRYQERNEADTAGSWSTAVQVSLLSEIASQLLIAPDHQPTTLVEIEGLIFLEAHRWERDETAGSSTYRIPFDRAHYPIQTWYPIDLKSGGARQAATLQQSIAAVEANANSFFLDETSAAAGYLYYRPSSTLHPGGLDGFRGLGVGLVVRIPMANRRVVSGPTGDVPYLPIVLGVPSVEDTVSSFREGRGATPSGDLKLANISIPGEGPREGERADLPAWPYPVRVADLDGFVPGGDRLSERARSLWWRLAQLTKPNPGVGMLLHRQPLLIKQLPHGATYDEAIPLFEGEVGLRGATLERDAISLKTFGWEAAAQEKSFGARKIDLTLYANAPDSSIGRPLQHVFGSGHKRLEAIVVDTSTYKLTTGENVSAIDKFYMDGEEYPETWSFSAANQEITLTGASASTHIGEFHRWEFDGDGEELTPWDAGGDTADTRAGALFKRFLDELGLTADVLTAYFDALDDPASSTEWVAGLITSNHRVVFPRPTPVLAGIRVLEDSRGVHVRRRQDGKIDVVPMFPTELDEHSILVERTNIAGKLPYRVDTTSLGKTLVLEYMGYADVYEPITEETLKTWLTKPRWGVEGEVRWATTHSTKAGASTLKDFVRLDEPWIWGEFPVFLAAAALPPGTPILVNMADGPTEAGALDWALFKIERAKHSVQGTSKLSARYCGQAGLALRPERLVVGSG